MERLDSLQGTHEVKDARYDIKCHVRQHDEFADNPSMAEAVTSMSEKGFKYFQSTYDESKLYKVIEEGDGFVRVKRIGHGDATARELRDGERCDCNKQKAFKSMCAHEVCKLGGKFERSLMSERMFSGIGLGRDIAMSVNDFYGAGRWHDEDHSEDIETATGKEDVDAEYTQDLSAPDISGTNSPASTDLDADAEDSSESSDGINDDVPLSSLKRARNDSKGSSNMGRPARKSRRQLMDAASDLADACGSSFACSDAAYGAIIMIKNAIQKMGCGWTC